MADSLEQSIFQACLLEATARKAGNVHPEASFEHLSYQDFVRSAEAAAPEIALAEKVGVGQAILNSVQATRRVCNHNTNLGIILLLCPLAAVSQDQPLVTGLNSVLEALSVTDSRLVFEAIRLASPRGLGEASNQDVADEPTRGLLEIMRLAADRDLIARQFTSRFELVFQFSRLLTAESFQNCWEVRVQQLQLELIAATPETDILRKRGADEAKQASLMARNVLEAGWPESDVARALFDDFDAWLRAEGSQRNPGTAADLVTACLFVALREKRIAMPDLTITE